MQTFLSEPDYERSAAALDNKRLNKQLLECRQIFTALAGESKGWVNHPATRMWADTPGELLHYASAIAVEANYRGIATDKNWSAIYETINRYRQIDCSKMRPYWWHNDPISKDRIMHTHRANLYAKDPVHYADYKVDYTTYIDRLADNPESLVCCATRRAGKPCGYYWPSHVKE